MRIHVARSRTFLLQCRARRVSCGCWRAAPACKRYRCGIRRNNEFPNKFAQLVLSSAPLSPLTPFRLFRKWITTKFHRSTFFRRAFPAVPPVAFNFRKLVGSSPFVEIRRRAFPEAPQFRHASRFRERDAKREIPCFLPRSTAVNST